MAHTMVSLHTFLGLNESPDGDTALKDGELSQLQNFRITPEGHLQVRPGSRTVLTLPGADGAGNCGGGLWFGQVGEHSRLLAAYAGTVYSLRTSSDDTAWQAAEVGRCAAGDVTFFPFDRQVYLLDGETYQVWDGDETHTFAPVEGYVPLVLTAGYPDGRGTLLEPVNRLTALRRARFSPDGTAKTFQLPETELSGVEAVEGTDADWTVDLKAGKVTFSTAPAAAVNALTVTYRKGEGAAGEVGAMRYAELFNGAADTRVFLCGDGSSRAIYSGLTADGAASAAYFPDGYEIAVGSTNTPLTGLVRHHNRLLAAKPEEMYSIRCDLLTLADGSITAAFYCTPVHRGVGNEAPGQMQLVENEAITLCARGVYRWSPLSSGTLTADERCARRISRRVEKTLAGFPLHGSRTYHDRENRELWIIWQDTALIWQYEADVWYRYTGLDITAMTRTEDFLLLLGRHGAVRKLERTYRSDDGQAIDACAATGSMDFRRPWLRKYTMYLWLSLLPEDSARIFVSAESNRRSDYPEKCIASHLATFSHVHFAHFSFRTNRKPQIRRVKLKVKKAAFCRLVFRSCSASSTATVLGADLRLHYGGDVKS